MKRYQPKGNDNLLIINYKTSKKVPIKNVILAESCLNYTTLHLEGGKMKMTSHTLKFYEKFLRTHGFLRVHRACMINPNFVKEYSEKQEFITMTNGHQAQISRRRKHELKGL